MELIKCMICDGMFMPDDDFDFVCADCRSLTCPECGSDAVEIDWNVNFDTIFTMPYYWRIECACGHALERSSTYADFDNTIVQMFDEWQRVSAGGR